MLLIGVSLLVLGHQLWLWARGWRFDALHPYFLCDVMIFALFGLGSLVVEYPNWSIGSQLAFQMYILAGIVAYYLGLHTRWDIVRLSLRGQLRLVNPLLSLLTKNQSLLVLLIAGIVLAVTLVTLLQRARVLSLSPIEMLLLPPLYVHTLLNQERTGAFTVILFYAFNCLLLIALYLTLSKRQYLLSGVVMLVILASTFALSVTRVPLIMAMLLPVAYYHYSVRSLNRLLVIGLFVVGPVLLTVLNNYRGGTPGGWTVIELMKKETVVLKSFSTLWEHYHDGKIDLEYGAHYYYYTPLTFVPRFLWSDKPETSFETRWTIALFGSVIDEDNQLGVHTFSPWGEGLVQFGVLGGVLNLYLFGLILNGAIQFFKNRFYAQLLFFNLSVLSATFIRTSVQTFLFTAIIYIVMTIFFEKLMAHRLYAISLGGTR